MKELVYTLLADGSSDRALLPLLRWSLLELGVQSALRGEFADLRSRREGPSGLEGRIRAALEDYPCDLLFVHRDTEGQGLELRRAEIAGATKAGLVAVAVVPVRMTEAWFLFDEAAIRRAAGNPSGRMELDLPPAQRWESVPDPKEVLRLALRTASGLQGRRLSRFETRGALNRIAELIDDFTPLKALPAYEQFEADLRNALLQLRCIEG